jgi:hypothetical protein
MSGSVQEFLYGFRVCLLPRGSKQASTGTEKRANFCRSSYTYYSSFKQSVKEKGLWVGTRNTYQRALLLLLLFLQFLNLGEIWRDLFPSLFC